MAAAVVAALTIHRYIHPQLMIVDCNALFVSFYALRTFQRRSKAEPRHFFHLSSLDFIVFPFLFARQCREDVAIMDHGMRATIAQLFGHDG